MSSRAYILARNRRLKCDCGGYHFPHRKGGGFCYHSKSRGVLMAKRHGSAADVTEAVIELALSKPGIPATVCPF